MRAIKSIKKSEENLNDYNFKYAVVKCACPPLCWVTECSTSEQSVYAH